MLIYKFLINELMKILYIFLFLGISILFYAGLSKERFNSEEIENQEMVPKHLRNGNVVREISLTYWISKLNGELPVLIAKCGNSICGVRCAS